MAKCDCGYCRVCVEYQDKSATRIIDELIASWLGFTVCGDSVFLHEEERGLYRDGALKKYSTSDAAAVSLLPELVKRGYDVDLFNDGPYWLCIAAPPGPKGANVEYQQGSTIAAAITAAVCQLIKDI